MEKNILNYFNNKLKILYPELECINIINTDTYIVKITSKNKKEWTGKIFMFTDKDYQTLKNNVKKTLTAGINTQNIY